MSENIGNKVIEEYDKFIHRHIELDIEVCDIVYGFDKLNILKKNKLKKEYKERLDRISEEYMSYSNLINKRFPIVGKYNKKIFNTFFKKNLKKDKNLDVLVILNSGMSYTYNLNDYKDNINLMYFRPKYSYHYKFKSSFLFGKPKNNKLLIIDQDIYRGCALSETLRKVREMKYNPKDVFVYIEMGFVHKRIEAFLKNVLELEPRYINRKRCKKI